MFTLADVKVAIGSKAHMEHAYLVVTKEGEISTASMDSEEDPSQHQELVAGYFNSFHIGENLLNPDSMDDERFVRHCYHLLVFVYHKFLLTKKVCWVGTELSDALRKKSVETIIPGMCEKIEEMEMDWRGRV